jgi:cell wall-associated NlpC family hydrolase
MTGKAGIMVAGACAVLLLPVILVVLVIGGSSSASGQTPALTPGAALNAAAVPNQAWVPWVEQAGAMCSVITAPIIGAQIQTESGWDPTAVSPGTPPNGGAEGLSQFEPGTWPSWGRDDAGDGDVSPFNPIDAIMAQGRYDCALSVEMTTLAQQTGIPLLTLTLDAYNAGPGAVLAAHGIPQNPQTEAYAPAIEALATKYTASGGSSTFGAAVVAAGESQIGEPYVWGGGSPTGPTMGGFDCSGLVLYAVFQASGGAIDLPHLSEDQVTMGTGVTSGTGAQVLASGLLQPGDVIGFYNLDADNEWDHVGIYVGNDSMVVAPETGQDVQIQQLDNSYWEGVQWTVRSFG